MTVTSPIAADGASSEVIELRLYIAGNSPNSERARYELRRICEEYLAGRHRIETVDVWEQPEVALADRVFATPALRKLSPGPGTLIFGDLSQTEQVLSALGIETKKA